MGMSYDQYWNDDALLVKFYREADELKRRRENFNAFLTGRYVYDALCCVAPVLTAFPKKGAKVEPFLKEPYPITAREQAEATENKAKQDMLDIKASFEAYALKFNEQRRQRSDY